MFKINLAPEIQQQKQSRARKNTYATLFSIILVAVTVAALVIIGAITVAQGARLNSVKTRIDEVNKESENYKELENTVLSLEAGLNGVRSALDGKNSWTRLLPHIEAATPAEVTFKSLDISSDGTIDATLETRTIDALAKFIESYKRYQVIALRGEGSPGEKVIIKSGEISLETTITPGGRWAQAIKINPNQSSEITVNIGEKRFTLNYSSDTRSITTDTPGLQFERKNLFKNINTTRYERGDGGVIKFDSTFNIQEGVLW